MEISVLMSVYYKEKDEYLKTSLESILNQTFKPSQVVIIKDGELTKELDNVLEYYKNKYDNLIEIYQLEEHRGLGEALKFGVERCKFEYIARQDSDDISPQYRFKKQVEILEQDKNIDILGGYIEEYNENMTELLDIRKVPLEMQEIKKYIKTQTPFNHGTVIMKKQAILRAGSYSNAIAEDYDLWARMLICGSYMKNIPMILGKNRTGVAMLKRRSGIRQIKMVWEVEKNLLHYGIINIFQLIYNITIRTIVALCPIKCKSFVYKNFIRKL